MRKFIVIIWFVVGQMMLGFASINVVTWNIQDLGRSKSDSAISAMAQILREADIVAIQEVVAKDPAGAKAVARLVDELNRKGSQWDYRVSNPTKSPSVYISERYAFIWKTSSVRLIGRATLDESLEQVCDREPFIAQFRERSTDKSFYIVNFHARRFDNNPHDEIKEVINQQLRDVATPVFLVGDFNVTNRDDVWLPLYELKYVSALDMVPTTLKRKCTEEYMNHPIDNIYFPSAFCTLKNAQVLDFVQDCSQLNQARRLSDHLPVAATLELE